MSNHIDDKPVQAIARAIRHNLHPFMRLAFESGKQHESVAVWLVGMSTGAIALIISQFGKLSSSLHFSLRASVLFLTGTIVLGLLFRIFHLFWLDRLRSDTLSVTMELSRYIEPYMEPPVDLPEDSSAGFIAWCLFDSMGIQMEPDLLIEIEARNDVEYWRNQYKKYTSLYHRLEKLKHRATKPVLKEFLKSLNDLETMPSRKVDRAVKSHKFEDIKKRYLESFCNVCYVSMCISFAISVLIISCSFITTDWKTTPSSTTNQEVVSPTEQVQPTQVNESE